MAKNYNLNAINPQRKNPRNWEGIQNPLIKKKKVLLF